MMVTSRSMRRKFFAVLFSTTLFTGLAIALVASLELPLERHAPVVLGIGLVISLFEEFYVQGKAGRWLRAKHPLLSITIYSGLIVVFAITIMWLAHGFFGHQQHGNEPHTEHGVHWIMYFVLPQLFGVAIFAIVTLRVIGYLGGRNLFDLMTGEYFRPLWKCEFSYFSISTARLRSSSVSGPLRLVGSSASFSSISPVQLSTMAETYTGSPATASSRFGTSAMASRRIGLSGP